MKRYCFALDLINDSKLIRDYIEYHKIVWPEIIESLQEAGIVNAEIYQVHDRLFLIMDTNATFSLEKKAKMDAKNPIVQQWETIMWKYQKALPSAKPGEKWVLMNKIFEL
ncbi:L-rhamnose mutarotase [Flavobacterium fluviatile]|uniref:L-rhamnose mutarotase n=1 Tax=Flavobacterium fluviatile TaxID=1862387 RepID=UPI0013D46C28|nr:L-rhamnose mutarotase [Flavobacterium fluviatile]